MPACFGVENVQTCQASIIKWGVTFYEVWDIKKSMKPAASQFWNNGCTNKDDRFLRFAACAEEVQPL